MDITLTETELETIKNKIRKSKFDKPVLLDKVWEITYTDEFVNVNGIWELERMGDTLESSIIRAIETFSDYYIIDEFYNISE